MGTIKYEEKAVRVCQLPYEDKPHKHTFYKYFGKMGTHGTTIIWTIDKLAEQGEYIWYVCEDDYVYPADKTKYMKYIQPDKVHYAEVWKAYTIEDGSEHNFIFVNA